GDPAHPPSRERRASARARRHPLRPSRRPARPRSRAPVGHTVGETRAPRRRAGWDRRDRWDRWDRNFPTTPLGIEIMARIERFQVYTFYPALYRTLRIEKSVPSVPLRAKTAELLRF